MTDEELKAIEVRAKLGITYVAVSPNSDWPDGSAEQADADRDALLAEVRRLKGLIARVEWRASNETPGGDAACPWCDAENGVRERNIKHALNCDAFTPDGDVR